MAGSSRYELALKVMKKYDGQVLNVKDLRVIIMKYLATAPNVVKNYLALMEATGLTKETDPFMFLVNAPEEVKNETNKS